MLDANALLREGDLAGARAALVETVRARPGDEQARMFLFQLLAVLGEWDKARSQLQALAQLSPEAQMLSAAYGQVLAAEAERRAVFAGEQRIAVLANPGEWAAGLAEAIELLARGETAAGIAARDAAFDAVPDCPGSFNGAAFDWIADADSRFGPSVDAIVGGRYGLIPFDAVERMTSAGPRDLRDLVWLPVEIAMKSGQSIAGFLPARYPGSEASLDSGEQLARTTSWREVPWGDAGSGQRLWSFSAGEDQGVLALRLLEFG